MSTQIKKETDLSQNKPNLLHRSAGIVPILYTLMSELFPTEIRTQAIGITEALYLASEGVGVKLYPEMRNSMGLCGVCLLYAAMGFLNVIWGGLTIPDNRGKKSGCFTVWS